MCKLSKLSEKRVSCASLHASFVVPLILVAALKSA